MRVFARNNTSMSCLTCDYLVIGAGASAMAFVDELIHNSKELTVVMMDKRAKPGGKDQRCISPCLVYHSMGLVMLMDIVRKVKEG